VRTLAELEELIQQYGLGSGVLATIAIDATLGEYGALNTTHSRSAETFRLLRARLRYLDVKGVRRVITITSATSGEGKSTVCFNLAAAYASTGARVLLIEADLRKAEMVKRLRMPQSAGLAEYLSQQALGLKDVVRQLSSVATQPTALGAAPAPLSVDVIVAGGLPPNPAELLQSPRMTALLERARSSWDVIVIDAAPIGLVSDAFPLLSASDGVLVVARLGVVSRDGVHRVSEDLNRAGASLLGVVANGVRTPRDVSRGYGYGYNGRNSNKTSSRAAADTHEPVRPA
jgi:capsular exopolysaccharide synthesis family protein